MVLTKEANHVKPTVLGTLVHRICELLDKGYVQTDAIVRLLQILFLQRKKSSYRKHVTPLVDSYQNKDFGEPIANEWEFVLELEGVQIIGEIDKVVEREGKFEVIDLKTNRIHDNVEELISNYKPQLYLYKMAYETHEQTKIDRMSLAFLSDPGKGIYQVEYEPNYEQQIIEAIREMAEIKKG